MVENLNIKINPIEDIYIRFEENFKWTIYKISEGEIYGRRYEYNKSE